MLFFLFFLILALILQGSVTTLPLILVVLLNFAVSSKRKSIFFLAFLSGLALDIMLLNILGQTSVFLILFIAIIIIYEKKYDIQTYPFVFIASFLGSLAYFILFGGRFIFMQSAAVSLISLLFFWGVIQADRVQVGPKKMLYG